MCTRHFFLKAISRLYLLHAVYLIAQLWARPRCTPGTLAGQAMPIRPLQPEGRRPLAQILSAAPRHLSILPPSHWHRHPFATKLFEVGTQSPVARATVEVHSFFVLQQDYETIARRFSWSFLFLCPLASFTAECPPHRHTPGHTTSRPLAPGPHQSQFTAAIVLFNAQPLRGRNQTL